jgi:hypothetical protein
MLVGLEKYGRWMASSELILRADIQNSRLYELVLFVLVFF